MNHITLHCTDNSPIYIPAALLPDCIFNCEAGKTFIYPPNVERYQCVKESFEEIMALLAK